MRLTSMILDEIEADLNQAAQTPPKRASFFSSTLGLAILLSVATLAVLAFKKRQKRRSTGTDTLEPEPAPEA